MTQRAAFISFEGGDGVGKSTQVELLVTWLRDMGHDVVETREPGGTELGRSIRRIVLHGGDVSPRAEALLYAADRAHHVAEVIRPALNRGSMVVTDRYLDSSVAYQAGGRELAASQIEDLSRWATDGLLPHRTFLLDLAPGDAATRRDRELDRLEAAGDEFHQRTRQAFLDRAAAEPDRWRVLDASRTPEDIAAEIRADVAALLDALGERR